MLVAPTVLYLTYQDKGIAQNETNQFTDNTSIH